LDIGSPGIQASAWCQSTEPEVVPRGTIKNVWVVRVCPHKTPR